jgi:4-hydroxy-tetrahydrodipicolinate synthase
VISVVGNIVPDRMVNLINAFSSGNLTQALRLHEELLPISQAMFFETNPISVKAAMNYLGLSAGSLRLPLVAMQESNKRRLISVLEKGGVHPIR